MIRSSWGSIFIISGYGIIPNIGSRVGRFIPALMNYFENMEVVILAESLIHPSEEIVTTNFTIVMPHQPIIPTAAVC